jgi:phage/plasmid primase-like uncharacterized protein
MRCVTRAIETLPDGRTLHRCLVCGKEGRFRTADPAHVGMQCGVKALPHGPGTELAAVFKQLGIKPKAGCGCKELAREMNALGVDGCRRECDSLAAKLRSRAALFEWQEKVTAAVKAATSGLATRLNWRDPFPGLVDLAIERARAQSRLPAA